MRGPVRVDYTEQARKKAVVMNRITVLIADDHAISREGLGMFLAQEEDIQVVGEATDDLHAIGMTEALQPDILLLDVKIPALGGIETLPKIREKSPGTKVLILSEFSEAEFMVKVLQLGAKGYLSNSLAPKDLVKAIRATEAGEIWAERKVVTEALESLRQKVQAMNLLPSEIQEVLTDREYEISKWVIQGMTNKEIAAQLGISDKTVKTHLSNIFNKLKISRRSHVRHAVQMQYTGTVPEGGHALDSCEGNTNGL